VATLALSVNMVGRGFTIEEFTRRTTYLVQQVAARNPARPIFCITIYPYYGDWSNELAKATAPPEEFRLALERVAGRLRADGAGARIELVPGPSLLTDVGGLCVDMIHPGDHGMLEMGERLAARMRPAVERLRASGVNRRRGGTS
jgi:lysophospholipase L1-like esterase